MSIIKFLETYNSAFSSLASLVAIFAGLGAFVIYASNSHRTFVKERDQKFIGSWANLTEGCLDCSFENDPKHPIVLTLDVTEGKVSGTIDASGWLDQVEKPELPEKKITEDEIKEKTVIEMAKRNILQFIMVTGDLSFNHGTIELWDYVDGKRTTYGKAKISVKGGVMKWQIKRGHFIGFPLRAEMYQVKLDEEAAE